MREHEIEALIADINERRDEMQAAREGDPTLLRDDEDEEDYCGEGDRAAT